MSGFDLPEEWCLTKIGDVCSKITDGSHNPPKASTEGLPMLSAKNINNGMVDFNLEHRLIPYNDFWVEDKRTNIQVDDVLLTIVGALGRSALVVKEYAKFTLQRSVAVLAAPHLDAKCFRYSLEEYQFQKQVLDNAKGTAQKGIYLKKLSELTLPIPPLAEQKEIADRLDKLLAQVEATQARLTHIPHIIKQFRQSVLATAVSGELTEEWRDNNEYITNAYCEEWNWIGVPKEWTVNKYSEVVDSRLGKMLDKVKNSGTAVDYLGNINVRWFHFEIDSLQKIRASDTEIKDLNLIPGDVLICEGGEPGRCAIWKNNFKRPVVFQKALHRARVSKKILPEWLVYNIKNDVDNTNLSMLFTGTTIKHLTGKALAEYPLRIPPVEEQTEIVRRVEQLFAYADSIEQQAKAAKARVDNLTQAILAKAFRGELTADWRAANPDLISGDNSAAALLARIQAERAQSAKKSRKSTQPAP